MVDIKFTLEDCKINYHCTGMDERLREILDFMAKNSFEFCSELYPEIRINVINLRGEDKSQDNNAQIINFNSIYKRDSFIEGVKEAFEELKVYLKKEYPEDYTEPTLTIIDKDEKESDKIIDDVKEDEYEYLTAESLKEILNGREEYITNTIIKTIDKAIREKVSRGCDWFYLFPENFKVSTENKEIQDKATEHFSNIGIDIEWDVKTMSLPICNVKVVK